MVAGAGAATAPVPRRIPSLAVAATRALTTPVASAAAVPEHADGHDASDGVTYSNSYSNSNDAPRAAPAALVRSAHVDRQSGYVRVVWEDGRASAFHNMWLRHNCKCARCVEASSGQLLMDLANLDKESTITNVSVDASKKTVEVEWAGAGSHTSSFRAEWLREHRVRSEREPTLSRAAPVPQGQQHDYGAIMVSDEALHKWVQELAHHGWAIVQGAPVAEGTVSDLARRISRPMPSIYGESFDVVAEERPINIAYSSLPLGLHQDLAYYESVPGLQFLHCRAFSPDVVGGESTMMDAFALAERMRARHPEHFAALTRVPVTFKKIHYERSEPVHMTYRRPLISLNPEGDIINVAWSPPFQGVTETNTLEEMDALYRAMAKFAQLVDESTDLLREFRLAPGQVLTFNNRRMLHGRRGFTLRANSVRHLEGVYLNIDEFKSRVRVLATKYGGECPRHIGNQDIT